MIKQMKFKLADLEDFQKNHSHQIGKVLGALSHSSLFG